MHHKQNKDYIKEKIVPDAHIEVNKIVIKISQKVSYKDKPSNKLLFTLSF